MRTPLVLAMAFILVISACNTRPPQAQLAIRPTETLAPTETPTATVTPVPTATVTPTPIPVDIGKTYTGYWLKMSKDVDPVTKSQTMTLYYQDGQKLFAIATFCVRAGDNNTPNGMYFIAIDRPTTYPTAHGGYATTFFSHNFAWKISYRNWYLHAAPWNTLGIGGCPTNGSGGCVNMRTEDFNVLLNGGHYVNPITGVETEVPDLGVGTPFVIAEHADACTYLGQCIQAFACNSGADCFRKFTCEFCIDPGPRWEKIVYQTPNLKTLDLP